MSAPDGAGGPQPIGQIAHYNLLERLDPAGPGDLYRARDTRKGRTVVIRLLPADFAGDAASGASLIDAARSVGVLSHPNVTTLFDAGEHEGRVYLVFEFLTGRSLRAEMSGRPMNVRRAVDLAIQIADAIAQAHSAGFAHAGLSPESIVVTAKGSAKIPAFPLATRDGFEPDGITLRDYDSPEEARGEPADDRSDVYSVGAILYDMLASRRPPHKGAAAPSASNRHVTPELDDVVLRAVAPHPQHRQQAAATLAGELRGIAGRLDVQELPGDDIREMQPVSGGAGRWMTLILVAALLTALAWWFTR